MLENVLYQSIERGIIVFLRQYDIKLPLDLAEKYPLMLVRCGQGRFALSNKSSKPHAWTERIILDTFKSIGLPVQPSIRKNQYYITGRKEKFQFILKYGRWGDK